MIDFLIIYFVVIPVISIMSILGTYFIVFYSDWIQCTQCETIYRSTIRRPIDKESNVYHSQIAGGKMLNYCDRCIGYL